jgi:chromate transporter
MAEQEPQAAQPERTPDGVASRIPIWDLVRYYLRLGTLGFGGPVALCGQMERELVGERR